MHLIYIDESRDEELYVFSALAIAADRWQAAFQGVRQFRHDLQHSDGIRIYEELHAWKFVSGRGDIADRVVTKGRRCQIFRESLQMTATLPGVSLINAVYPANQEEAAFDALLDGINRMLCEWGSHAILVCDDGKEETYTRLARRRHIYSPVATSTGRESSQQLHNGTEERILEDPFFKPSDQSYFVQLSDFCAYALLRRERPLPSKSKYGLDRAFSLLSPIFVLEANPNDPEGVIRP
jgi:hypothetical protein